MVIQFVFHRPIVKLSAAHQMSSVAQPATVLLLPAAGAHVFKPFTARTTYYRRQTAYPVSPSRVQTGRRSISGVPFPKICFFCSETKRKDTIPNGINLISLLRKRFVEGSRITLYS
ncbi:hypothetical protein TNIN_417661 [Trichonephila inaurata madagascariensis]|uniref:Uncharacterized protein n=1 Tax=Trichonephila inaurata madagascariensis TaxID=2747483 RepID=A0A8X6X1D9_9ARAC|nr:hypothetical protein TNIN_417661 [Trichonephila inaurata madagascariensis]